MTRAGRAAAYILAAEPTQVPFTRCVDMPYRNAINSRYDSSLRRGVSVYCPDRLPKNGELIGLISKKLIEISTVIFKRKN